MIPVRTVFILALLAGVCAGCAAQQPDAPTSSFFPGSLGTAFEIDGQFMDASEPQRQASLLLSADGDRLSGSAGTVRMRRRTN